MLPPLEKGNVFRVTSLLLWGEIEPSRPGEGRPFPAKVFPTPPPAAGLGQRMQVVFTRIQLSGPRGIPVVGRERAERIHWG